MNSLKKSIAAILLIAALPLFLAAADVASVVFEQNSSYKFSEEMLSFNVQTKKGTAFDEKILNDDIKRLYSTGYFSDVVTETKPQRDGKVAVIFKITPKPVVKNTTVVGNKKLDWDKLKEKITLTEEAPLSDVKLRESAANIRKFYEEEGYNDAIVTPRLETAGENMVNVIFDVKENLRLRVNSVKFEGNTVYSSWDLKDEISTSHSYLSWILEVGLLNREELEKDKVRLRELYWQKGYLDFKVEDITIAEDPKDPVFVDVTFKLFEGEPYKVGRTFVTGNQKFTSEELLATPALVKDEPFDSRKERKDVDAINAKYYALGYADFICRPVRMPNYETHTVDVEYQIVEGGTYVIRDIVITGNKVTQDKVIRRELPVNPGDPVDKNMIDVGKSRLMGMGYFENVDAVTVASGEQGKKDVQYEVKEKTFMDAKIGAGASDTEGIAGVLELSHTNADIFDPLNYFSGGGQRIRAIAMMGISRYNFELDFTEPWMFGMPLKYDWSAYFRNVAYEYWDERRLGITNSLTKRFYDDFTSASVGYTIEQVRVYDMDKSLSQMFQNEETTDIVSRPHIILDRDTRDNINDPTSGYDLNLLSALTTKALGASNNYYRLEGKGMQFIPFFDKNIIFDYGAKAGSIGRLFTDTDKMVPIYERYFLGGGDSIRGFPYREVSPYDDNKDVYGGQMMYVLTSEVTHPIYKIVRGAVFVDAGNVYRANCLNEIDKINVGAGYGLRIKLPHFQQPIKLDLAYPLVNRQENVSSKLRFHFNMGFSW